MRSIIVFTVLAILALSGCTWGIKLSDAGRQVRTAWNGDVSQCRDLGKVTVSVMDHVGPVDRDQITVNDELEVMARNEAAGMQADTIKPLGNPQDGQQSWEAYRCGAAGAPASGATATPKQQQDETPRAGAAKTFPVKSGGGGG